MAEDLSDTAPLVAKKAALSTTAVEPIVHSHRDSALSSSQASLRNYYAGGNANNNNNNNNHPSNLERNDPRFLSGTRGDNASQLGGRVTKSASDLRRLSKQSAWARVVNSSNKQLYAVSAAMFIMLVLCVLLLLHSYFSAASSHSSGTHSGSNGSGSGSGSSSVSRNSGADVDPSTLNEDIKLVGPNLKAHHENEVTDGWLRMVTTWASPDSEDEGFFHVPLTLSEADSDPSWARVSSCKTGDIRTGELYAQDGELSVMPIYHAQSGRMQGLMIGSEWWNSTYSNSVWHTFILENGTEYSAVQFLFREPSDVCSHIDDETVREYLGDVYDDFDTDMLTPWTIDRAIEALQGITDQSEMSAIATLSTAADYLHYLVSEWDHKKIGDRLLIRTTDSATDAGSDFYSAPLTRDVSTLNDDGWSEGTCFPRMGEHWWRYVKSKKVGFEVNCNNWFEVFLLYNRGGLTAFGTATTNSRFAEQTTRRWEHVAGSSTRFFFKPGDQPSCFNDIEELSTLHVYLDDPNRMMCVL